MREREGQRWREREKDRGREERVQENDREIERGGMGVCARMRERGKQSGGE
jgi:hypothetical protein